MSHDRPTHAERAAAAEHDPLTCWVCLNPDKHGDQAEDPVEAGLRAQLAAAKRERDVLRQQLESLSYEHAQCGDLLDASINAETEACAKVAEGPGVKLNDARYDVPERYRGIIAAAIRARGGR